MSYAEEYRNLHKNKPEYGSAGSVHFSYVWCLLRSFHCGRIIDYGCGKGSLGKSVQEATGIDTYLYDPYNEDFSTPPVGKFDLLMNTDVLEHVPEDLLDVVLSDMKALSERCYFVISTRFADQMLENGENAHCTVRSKEWWGDFLKRHFPVVTPVPTADHTACSFITWKVDEEVIHDLENIGRARKKKYKNARKRVSVYLRNIFGFYLSERDILRELKGKSVSLVGNARSLSNFDFGEKIDSSDLVIRCNRAPIVSYSSHGRRTDWIATGMALDSQFLASRKIKRVLWLSPFRKHLSKSMIRDRNMFVEPLKNHFILEKRLGKRPSTGFIMIDLLSRSECSSVEIYGFDFFDSLSTSGHDKIASDEHDFIAERDAAKDVFLNDSRFRLHG